MLRLTGDRQSFCDGVSRRSFLQLGAMGIGGLTLPSLLRAEAGAATGATQKSVINIYLGGGPSHMDMFDLKPNAPVEYRGEFVPTSTNVPGMEICQLMPKLATMADKFAVVRSLSDAINNHSADQTLTGYHRDSLRSVGGRPALGSVVAKLQAADSHGPLAPPFLSFMGNVNPGYLGPVYQPYQPSGAGRSNLELRSISAERLNDRTALLGQLDQIRRDADGSGKMEALDSFAQSAVGVITSGKLADALDLGKEDPRIVERYTGGARSGRAKETERFLLARRAIEAGVRVVTLNWGGWDTHGNNFKTLREQLPALDQGLSALLTDLYERSMLNDVTVVMWGEFGRTPKVNSNAGRDHWSRASQVFLAGGGMRTGQMVGSTTPRGEEPLDRP
ncbi:MAG: DUF1501 domain-containing protein, partial [Planctomycetales bacterium]|nr:DUF1501 domain-containing protein [Planctomycetales bacterium]